VIDCAGTVAEKPPAPTATSARREIEFEEVSCHTWAAAPGAKPEILTVTGVLPESTLLTTITVSAPSDDRSAAKADRLSGFGTVAETLGSPNEDLFPS